MPNSYITELSKSRLRPPGIFSGPFSFLSTISTEHWPAVDPWAGHEWGGQRELWTGPMWVLPLWVCLQPGLLPPGVAISVPNAGLASSDAVGSSVLSCSSHRKVPSSLFNLAKQKESRILSFSLSYFISRAFVPLS